MPLRLFCATSQLLPPTKLARVFCLDLKGACCKLWDILKLMRSGPFMGKVVRFFLNSTYLEILNLKIKLYVFIIYNST